MSLHKTNATYTYMLIKKDKKCTTMPPCGLWWLKKRANQSTRSPN